MCDAKQGFSVVNFLENPNSEFRKSEARHTFFRVTRHGKVKLVFRVTRLGKVKRVTLFTT